MTAPTLTGYGDGTYGAGTYGGVIFDVVPRWVVQIRDPAGNWVDATCDVRAIEINVGRTSWVEAFAAATARVTFANFAGIYSTFPPNSIWLQPGGYVTDVPIRIGTTLAGGLVWRFTGTTDTVDDSWPGTRDALATVTATDGFKQLARHNGGPRVAAGDGELTGARIGRLADDARWTGPRAIDAGVVTLQATTLDGVTLDLMRQIGESEWGWLYVAGDGALTFRQRNALDTDPRMTTVQYTFTDDDALAGACYGSAVVASGDDRIINWAQITPAGHAKSEYADWPSVDWYGPRTWTRTDLPIRQDTDAAGLAQLIVLEQANDDQRIDAVAVDAAGRPGNYAAAHGVRVNDRVRFVRTYPGGYQLDAELLVQGRRDLVEAAGDGTGHPARWDLTLATSSAVSIASLGAWDIGTWDESVWGV